MPLTADCMASMAVVAAVLIACFHHIPSSLVLVSREPLPLIKACLRGCNAFLLVPLFCEPLRIDPLFTVDRECFKLHHYNL